MWPICAASSPRRRTGCQNSGAKTILFIDEIHRFNKAQQDVLLPDVESGTIRLIGATTHNPFFYINGPLVSRSQVFQLEPLAPARSAGAAAARAGGCRARAWQRARCDVDGGARWSTSPRWPMATRASA